MKQVAAMLLAGALFTGLCACSGTSVTDGTPTSTAPRTEATLLDVPIEHILTKDQVERAVGRTMTDSVVKESGTQLYFLSEDGKLSVTLNINKQDRARFDQNAQTFPDPVLAPNLGETALWVEAYDTLFVYAHGYATAVGIVGADLDAESRLLAARQIAALAAETLETYGK